MKKAGSRGHENVSSLKMSDPRKWRSGNWNTNPTLAMRASKDSGGAAAGLGKLLGTIDTSPDVCSHRPASTCSSVVFPLPLRPMIRPRLLGGTSMDTSLIRGASQPGGWKLRLRTLTAPALPASCAALSARACSSARACNCLAMSASASARGPPPGAPPAAPPPPPATLLTLLLLLLQLPLSHRAPTAKHLLLRLLTRGALLLMLVLRACIGNLPWQVVALMLPWQVVALLLTWRWWRPCCRGRRWRACCMGKLSWRSGVLMLHDA
mmetsp:Transcript_3060/g.8080  ORF Transcript_3060/g.8080 Transcript_3060/m.8080 type:complete len:266 (-) Transcript_3060:1830-2627(-)